MKKLLVFGSVVIFLIAIIFLSNSNFSKFNLNEKFGFTGNVIESGKYSNENYSEVIGNFEEIYFQKLKEGKKIYLIFGDENQINIATFEDIFYGNMNLVLGSQNSKVSIKSERSLLRKIIPRNNDVRFSIEGREYSFELEGDEKVYFIIEEDISKD